MKSKRIQWLDFAKGFSILFVIIAHCSSLYFYPKSNVLLQCFVEYFSYLFVMPMFFIISGFLYKKVESKKDYLLLIYKKVTSLLIPYFIFSIMAFAHNALFMHEYSLINIILAPNNYFLLWFLPSLFMMFLLIGFIDLLHTKRYILYLFSIVILFLSPIFWKCKDVSFSQQQWPYLIYSYLIFFCIGIFIKRHRKFFHNIFTITKFFILTLILFFISVLGEILITTIIYQNNIMTIVNIIPKTLMTLVLIMLFMNMREDTSFFKYFSKYGKYTLVIYLVHDPLLILGYKVIIALGLHGTIVYILFMVLSWFISVFICYLALKCRAINFIFYPRKYIDKLVLKTNFGKKLLNY